MPQFRGERFDIDLFDEQSQESVQTQSFVADVKERTTSAARPPGGKSNATGFPAHKKRTGTDSSQFKERRSGKDSRETSSEKLRRQPHGPPLAPPSLADDEQVERQRIDAENRTRLAQMTDHEIEAERQELFSGLSPALIQKLLRRSKIDDDPQHGKELRSSDTSSEPKRRTASVPRKVSFALPDGIMDEEPHSPTARHHSISSEHADEVSIENGKTDQTYHVEQSQSKRSDEVRPSNFSIHFPKPLAAPELDPTSSSFLEDLHETYFPNLAHDPSKLAWMTTATSEEDAPYAPTQAGLDPSAIRFSFKGALIPPSEANLLSTDLGLHHHGDAPSAAGYTIAELALLARSSFPAQRCVAFQTLGRILYRLGIGEFGSENDLDAQGPVGEKAKLAKGLWEAMKQNRVLDVLKEEAKKERGHQTSIALAQEAVWNWQRGGGRELKAV